MALLAPGALAGVMGVTIAPFMIAGAAAGFGAAMLTNTVPSFINSTTDPCSVAVDHNDNSTVGGGGDTNVLFI